MNIFTKIFLMIFLLTSYNLLHSQVTFTDVAPALGLNDAGNAQGVVFLDLNNDGFLDIFMVNNGGQSKLWINNGGTSFTESSATWGINISSPTRGCSAADFNNDGFTDIMIGNWQTPIMLLKNTGTYLMEVASSSGVGYTSYGGSINWFDYNKDGKVDAFFANDGMPPRYNYFFKNNNLLNFSEVSYSIGLVDSSSTLCLASGDYNNDGNLDVFLGTQSHPNSPLTGILYRNNGNGTFTDVSDSSGITTNYYTWGAEWGDYNNDGYLDLYLANYTGLCQLYKNNGNGTFTDVAPTMGVNDGGQAYSCGWADIDNDGDLDLYIAKGQTYMDKMYRNDGNIFTDISATIGMGDLRHSSCVSWGDYNNDGFLDMYLNNNGSENRLYKNSGNSNKWIILKLTGTNSNRSAIGTRVRIKTGTLNQIREVEGGSGGKGMNSLPVEFGIGTATVIDSVIVSWPSGLVQRFANVAPNTIYPLTEGQPLAVGNTGSSVPDKYSLSQNYPNPFNPTTNIKYQIANNGFVTLKVYDILGNEVATLVNEKKSAGYYEVTFDASNYPTGVYFYKLTTDNFTETKKMLMIK
jgi:hypothetical protein